jgi:hypothetical protein
MACLCITTEYAANYSYKVGRVEVGRFFSSFHHLDYIASSGRKVERIWKEAVVA